MFHSRTGENVVGNQKSVSKFEIRPATEKDVSTLLSLIKGLAEYEELSHEVTATEEKLRQSLFGKHPVAEVVIGKYQGTAISYALFFHNYSTFLGKPGIYLEDIYVKPEYRRKGFGRKLLAYIAGLVKSRDYGRFEWAVLNYNTPAINAYEKLDAVPMKDWTVYRLSGEALDRLADEI
jgi:GNAT superfamily N-acetyltransferase